MNIDFANKKSFLDQNSNREFLFDGIDWWPLVKTSINFQLFLVQSKGIEALPYLKDKPSSITANPMRPRDYVSLFKKLFFYKKTEAQALIITSDSHKNTPCDGLFINQYTDPFVDLFKINQISYEIYDLAGKRGSFDIDQLKKFYFIRAVKLFNCDLRIQNSIKEFSCAIQSFFGEEYKFDYFLSNMIIKCWSDYKAFQWFFRRYNFKKVLCYCYYNSSILPITLAANKQGITTVEYQHSQVSSEHLAYSGWKSTEENDFFPDIFWAWRNSDVKEISKGLSFKKSFKPLFGGNVFISKIFSRDSLPKDSKTRVLLTLQGIGIPDFISDYIKNSQNVLWYLRLHPRQLSDKELVLELKKLNPSFVEIDDANKLSLYELFPKMDYHMTSYSGSAIEAQAYGVSNIIYSEVGYSSYKEQIESNCYFFIENQNELNTIFEKSLVPENSEDEILIDEEEINKIFVDVFGD